MSDQVDPRTKKPFLYVVVCAAAIAGDVGTLVTAARKAGWDVGLVATPYALGFLDVPALEAGTGYPVRSAWRSPGDPRPLPPADAIAVAPATFNTINKWAAGMSDTLALGILCEAYGSGVPTAVLPYVNPDLAAHPAYRRSLDLLREMGVRVGSATSHAPGAEDGNGGGDEGGGGDGADPFRWEEALELLSAGTAAARPSDPPAPPPTAGSAR
ncbi:flavoprotein [Streptomyces sp. NPDC059134]|uniref:flavoprotein n=1 Tax=Streptomyces sp. NPDC059134 TaxID=3346738 RepID=UPI003689342D